MTNRQILNLSVIQKTPIHNFQIIIENSVDYTIKETKYEVNVYGKTIRKTRKITLS